MKKIFVSFFFQQDSDLAKAVEQLLASHNIRSVTGKRLGGGALTEEVKSLIDQSDGLVALVTREKKIQGAGWTTRQSVQYELNHARDKNIRTIALIQEGIDLGFAYAELEWIRLDRGNPFEAFLALSETIGIWKRQAGRIIKVQILPQDISVAISQNGTFACFSRFLVEGRPTPWRETTPRAEEGGTFLYVDGVADDVLIEVKVEGPGNLWQSPATSQWMRVNLMNKGRTA